MASFTFPQHLLHKQVEPQWFPQSKEETESNLNALEAAEAAYQTKLQKIVDSTPAAAIGVGVNGGKTGHRGSSGGGGGSRRHNPAGGGAGRRRRATNNATLSPTSISSRIGTDEFSGVGEDDSSSHSAVVVGNGNAVIGGNTPPRFFWNRNRTSTASASSLPS